jgi:hypothetical protein
MTLYVIGSFFPALAARDRVNIYAGVWFGIFGLASVGQQQEQANDGLQ